MKDKLEKMAKKGKKLSGIEKKAKMDVVGAMRDQAASMMGDKLKGLKRVQIASNSPEGLRQGLNKADELISHPEATEARGQVGDEFGYPGKMNEGSPEEEAHESVDEAMAEGDLDSPESIDQKIQELLLKKKALEHKQA